MSTKTASLLDSLITSLENDLGVSHKCVEQLRGAPAPAAGAKGGAGKAADAKAQPKNEGGKKDEGKGKKEGKAPAAEVSCGRSLGLLVADYHPRSLSLSLLFACSLPSFFMNTRDSSYPPRRGGEGKGGGRGGERGRG